MNLRKYLSRPKMNILLSEDEKRIGKFDVIADHFYQPNINYNWTHNLQARRLLPNWWIDNICLNDDGVYFHVNSAIMNSIKEHPEQKIWSISQPDNDSWCSCPRCKDENPYDTLINFVNSIAQHYPTKQFHTLLYYKTEQIGTAVPLPNVIVMLTTIQLSKHRPYQQQDREDCIEWVKNLKKLLKLTSNVGIWDYYGNFKHLLAPNPTLYSIGANMKWFRSLGIQHFIIQTDAAIGHEGSFWKEQWIYTMLCYPFLPAKWVLKRIWRKEFGRAAKYVKEYYDLLDANKGNGDYLSNWRDLEAYRDSFLSESNIDEMFGVIAKFGLAAEMIPLYLQRYYAETELNIMDWSDELREINKRLGGNVTVTETKKSVENYLKEKGL